ncbi:hypothetical protein D5F01_LYC22470 [Larimichthys crocea]|uniref:Uncharacterized protein n=1 Tax=Larimichthys crocea TaxID=215358 RepID=A0A6G0HI80_LARCR|nr:hypothetical protein D5F01_LYC22470 [Larimichthys crocea]
MQWTVQVIVVLLNIAWIAFFLQPDPFSVFVQRRSSDSSDEEMLFRQFCIQPHPDMNWASTAHSANITPNKTNSTNTTAEERGPRKLTTKTSTQPNDSHTSQSSDIDLTSPSPGSTPQQISMMGLFIVSKLLLISFALQSTEEKWKMHATAEPDNSVRYGEFCLRISDDSHRTSSKSVTQQPTKSARQTKQTTQQSTTEPDHFLDTDKPEEISQPYTEKPNDIIVPLIAPHNFQSHAVVLNWSGFGTHHHP